MKKIPTAELDKLMPQVQQITRNAGAIVMGHYAQGAAVKAQTKQDGSPVTAADHASHKFITAELAKLTPKTAIISEEDKAHADVSDGKPFWTVDPLDGTKGFINRTGQFFVKIALIEKDRPVLGVIYEPVSDTIYYARRDGKPYRQTGAGQPEELRTRPAPKKGELSTVFNRLHSNPEAYKRARKKLEQRNLHVPRREDAHGSCKTPFFMAVACGNADAYLDCGANASLLGGNGYSWDYAPDLLILNNAGGMMVEILSGQERLFSRPTEKMNACIGLGDKELGKRAFPEFKNDCV